MTIIVVAESSNVSFKCYIIDIILVEIYATLKKWINDKSDQSYELEWFLTQCKMSLRIQFIHNKKCHVILRSIIQIQLYHKR